MTQQAEQQAEQSVVPSLPDSPSAAAATPSVPEGAPPVPAVPPVPPELLPAPPPPKVAKDRRVLRAVLRWTAVAVAFAAVGTAAAYGVTQPERTDLPGLATEPDGRWDYPELVKPPLPAGSPAPFAEVNAAAAHYADLRELVLPAPKGAKADKALRGKDGWLATKDFLAEFTSKEDRTAADQVMTDYGLRHIAARGWTTPDGTHTRIYLLRFDTAAVADDMYATELVRYNSPAFAVRGADEFDRDEGFKAESELADVSRSPYAETEPYGAEQVRQAYLSAGDTVAVIMQSRKGTAKVVPFRQTVVLQSQLLS
ncbi:hypothetical protein ACFFS2_06230 [Streptomyces aurantiacus]|uniref:Uncharacterized protein n=1 Tax=Streptomyces aurantiacus TaxID=47760 RepID=A0A7G1NZV6_9ACTN|nr:hypothetical protein [Streptomyces aurantiacus]BCL29023.1 hypothetical protein GCM10017557_38820 [Streptomyces aurantiacus]